MQLIIFFLVSIFLLVVSVQAYAETIDDRISEQKITMQNHDKALKDAKEDLRIAKRDSNKSWDAIISIQEKEKAVQDAEQNILKGREKYISLLKEKSEKIKEEKKKKSESIKPFDQTYSVKKIGIDLSKSCVTLLKNNMNTTCPTFKDLISLDSSETSVSGKFTTDKDGWFHRKSGNYNESWRWYDHDTQFRIFVDPPLGMAERMPMITIEPNFDIFTLNTALTVQTGYNYSTIDTSRMLWNGTYQNSTAIKAYQLPQKTAGETSRILFHDRYVDVKCREAVINSDKWKMLLPDTIEYMRNGCDENHTSFNNKQIIPANFTEQDITTSQKWKDEQRLKWIKEFCIFKFQSCR